MRVTAEQLIILLRVSPLCLERVFAAESCSYSLGHRSSKKPTKITCNGACDSTGLLLHLRRSGLVLSHGCQCRPAVLLQMKCRERKQSHQCTPGNILTSVCQSCHKTKTFIDFLPSEGWFAFMNLRFKRIYISLYQRQSRRAVSTDIPHPLPGISPKEACCEGLTALCCKQLEGRKGNKKKSFRNQLD